MQLKSFFEFLRYYGRNKTLSNRNIYIEIGSATSDEILDNYRIHFAFSRKFNFIAKFVLNNAAFNFAKYFAHEDKQDKQSAFCCSNVMYSVTSSCGEFYIKQMKRNFLTRSNDHISSSFKF